MIGLLDRLGRIARAQVGHATRNWRKPPQPTGRTEPPPSHDREGHGREDPGRENPEGTGARKSPPEPPGAESVPQQVREDLAVFGLAPPVTWQQVRRARNREVKKYHSDRFVNDPERYDTSTEIMQIVNAAYERLERYYDPETKSP